MPFLDWVNKNAAKEATHNIPVHLLQQEAVYGDTSGPHSDNLLIQGDNLLALKALMPVYAGRIKCIFIDPPYNTQSAFEHYDDKLEHSQWLSMMYPRLVLLRELLSEDGSIWVTLDDNEAHYCKVLMDEVFSRQNFVDSVIWQKIYTTKNSARFFSGMHDHVLVYARSKERWAINPLPRGGKQNQAYKNPDHDPRGVWKATPLHARNYYSLGRYEVTSPSGRSISGPPTGTYWRVSEDSFHKLNADNRIWWGKDGSGIPAQKRFLTEVKGGVTPATLWLHSDAGHNGEAKNELRAVFPDQDDLFLTPKPERLIQRALAVATNPGDLVLDSFLGSGTTAAVAHKMGRRYIGIEMGDHAKTHCAPRLEKVINGEQGGVSEDVDWQGGGGFRFCSLGETAFDADGRVNPEVRFNTLASFIWHFETATPAPDTFDTPLLGVHDGKAYYLLYNGILGDKRPNGGNVLTRPVLQMLKALHPHDGPKIIYGETTRLGDASLAAEGVTFQQIPYDIKVR